MGIHAQDMCDLFDSNHFKILLQWQVQSMAPMKKHLENLSMEPHVSLLINKAPTKTVLLQWQTSEKDHM